MTQQLISLGSSANDGTGDPLRTAFTKANSNFSELYGRIANATDYGAVADGSTSLHTAINAAITAGVTTLVLDQGATNYVMTSTVAIPSGFRIVGGKGLPLIRWNNAGTSRMFTFGGVSNSGLYGLSIDGNNAVAPTDATIVINGSSSKITVRDCSFVNLSGSATGGIVISGGANRCYVASNQIDSSEGTAIGISGGYENVISDNQIRNSGTSWGIAIMAVSYKNLVIGNHSVTSGGEAIVVQYSAYQNRIIGNHCELTADNGISISGYANVVSGNICYNVAKAGIGVWGSENVITGNVIKNANYGNTAAYWAGVWVNSNYGGTGSFNTITGNIFDDDQASPTMNYAVRLHGNGYTTWATGQVISNLSDYTQEYRIYGLNIYQAQTTGTTGATPPTHTTGTVSDGSVTWLYLASFVGAAGTLWNNISGNVVHRYKTAEYFDSDSWSRNVLMSDTTTSLTITADGLVRGKPN